MKKTLLEPAELGDLSNDEGQAHLSSAKVSEIMNRHVNGIFQGCVAKKLIAIHFPKFSAPRMGADYTFSFE